MDVYSRPLMIPRKYIAELGGKFGVLQYAVEQIPDIPIPSFVVKGKSQGLEDVMHDILNLPSDPIIVRSTDSNEMLLLTGLLHSEKGCRRSSVKEAVRKVEERYRSAELREYAKLRRIKLESKHPIGFQVQSPSQYMGVMVRHPNNPSKVIINISCGEGIERSNWWVEYDSVKKKPRGSNCPTEIEGELLQALDWFEKIEGLEVMPGYSDRMEFGLRPLCILQDGPFRKKETAKFKVKVPKRATHDTPIYSFGITPPNGIVMPVVRGYSHHFTKVFLPGRSFSEFEKYVSVRERHVYRAAN